MIKKIQINVHAYKYHQICYHSNTRVAEIPCFPENKTTYINFHTEYDTGLFLREMSYFDTVVAHSIVRAGINIW